MSEGLLLPNPRFVLLNTSHPGNIGASARAMKNMGLTELYLVNPQKFPHAEATARASGADNLLASAHVHSTLEEAVADCVLVIGASARSRSLPIPTIDPHACAALVAEQSSSDAVAILFGNEQSGLSNYELDRCHYLVQIPTNEEYSSLNLAAAVQVIAYELKMWAVSNEDILVNRADKLAVDYASVQQVEQFYQHLEKALIGIEFLDPANPKQLMRRLRRLFGRVRLDDNEVNILRGILTAATKDQHQN